MRVALLTFYPSDTRFIAGGVRSVSYNLVQGLKAFSDLEIYVIHCHSDVEQDQTVSEGNVVLRYLAMPRRRIVPNMITSIGRVAREAQAIRPDVIHAHSAHFACAGIRAGCPTIFTIHGVLRREVKIYTRTLFDRLRYGLLAYYEARALRRVQKLVAISPYVLEEYGHIRPSAWVRIDNPIPQEFFDLQDRVEPWRILYAGSIDERKDVLTLLRAVERMRRVSPQVRLCIAGRATSGDYERRVRAYVVEHGLQDNVQFLGLLDRQGILNEYARCAVVALASLQETQPMAVIEGMAAAKPVVATPVGGIPDLIAEGETGFMTPTGDDATMAQRLTRVLADGGLAKSMGRRAREMARARFGVDQVARAYHDLYKQVATGLPGQQTGQTGE